MAEPTITRMRRKTPKVAAYAFTDDDTSAWCTPRRFGVVRCPDDDLETFDRLATSLLDQADCEPGEVTLAAPVWEWLRMNPSANDDYEWILGRANGPGRGTFRGVVVEEAGTDA